MHRNTDRFTVELKELEERLVSEGQVYEDHLWELEDNSHQFLMWFHTEQKAQDAAAFAREYVERHGDINFFAFPNTLDEPLLEGDMLEGRKRGHWTRYWSNGNQRSRGIYVNGQKEGWWMWYHRNGKRENEGVFRNGRKEGTFRYYEEDGQTVWRIITYRRGRRTKPDEFPLGSCPGCGEARRSDWSDACPRCGAEL